MARMAPHFEYIPHPRVEERKAARPVKVLDQRRLDHPNPVIRFNARFGLLITIVVGTMWCAYLFALIALISLPTVLKQAGLPIGFDFGGGTVVLIAWIAQTFLQLVLLSVIMVGQDVQSKAADKRADMTYKDAEAVLQEAREIQRHLAVQDAQLTALVAAVTPGGAPTQPA